VRARLRLRVWSLARRGVHWVRYNHSKPSITAVSPNPVDASGGQVVSIYGDNLGLVGLGPKPVVHINGKTGRLGG
jgi:hypothetical protein